MIRNGRLPVLARWPLAALAPLLVALGVVALPDQGWPAVLCPVPAGSVVDSDGDGFTDAQECTGITTAGTTPKLFPTCNGILPRVDCVDPNSKDVFIIYKPATTGSLLPVQFSPFGPLTISCRRPNNTSWCGTASEIRFTGFSSLGLTVHQLAPAQAATTRQVSNVSAQKAVRVSESLDASSPDVLGYCQWGRPSGLDGCTIYTTRARNFINAKCNAAGDAPTNTNRDQVFLAYATFLALHEAGHSLGGLAARYDAKFGGYHYPATSNVVMAQAVQYSTQGGVCTWHIPSAWNLGLDPPGVKLLP
jgi:hypothetical protein